MRRRDKAEVQHEFHLWILGAVETHQRSFRSRIVCQIGLTAARVEVWPKNNVRLAVNSGEKKIFFHRKAPASFSVECSKFLWFSAVKIFFHRIQRNSYKKETAVQWCEPPPPACHQLRNPLRHLSLTLMIFPVNIR